MNSEMNLHNEKIIGTKIESNFDCLNKMNKKHPWVPNESQCRPTNENLLKKITFLENHQNNMKEYILKNIFKNGLEPLKIRFIKNDFPYQVIHYSNHWILWYREPTKNNSENWNNKPSDDTITNDIKNELKKINNHKEMLFFWYENPKMCFPEYFHVQVFWVYTCDIPS